MGLDPTVISKLPEGLQVAIYIGVFIAAVAWAYAGYLKKRNEHTPSPDLILQAGSIADVRPMRQAAEAMTSIEKHFAEAVEILRRGVEAQNQQTAALKECVEMLDRMERWDTYERGKRDAERGRSG